MNKILSNVVMHKDYSKDIVRVLEVVNLMN